MSKRESGCFCRFRCAVFFVAMFIIATLHVHPTVQVPSIYIAVIVPDVCFRCLRKAVIGTIPVYSFLYFRGSVFSSPAQKAHMVSLYILVV